MTANTDLLNRVRAALKSEPLVQEKKMFGGVTFMVRGKMCISVGRNRIMCRIDPKLHDAAIKHGCCRPVVMKGRPYRGYLHVDAGSLKCAGNLEYWIALALDRNRGL